MTLIKFVKKCECIKSLCLNCLKNIEYLLDSMHFGVMAQSYLWKGVIFNNIFKLWQMPAYNWAIYRFFI